MSVSQSSTSDDREPFDQAACSKISLAMFSAVGFWSMTKTRSPSLEQEGQQRIVLAEQEVVVEVLVDPALDVALDLGEVDEHPLRRPGPSASSEITARPLWPCRCLTFPLVVEQAVAVTKGNLSGHSIHGVSYDVSSSRSGRVAGRDRARSTDRNARRRSPHLLHEPQCMAVDRGPGRRKLEADRQAEEPSRITSDLARVARTGGSARSEYPRPFDPRTASSARKNSGVPSANGFEVRLPSARASRSPGAGTRRPPSRRAAKDCDRAGRPSSIGRVLARDRPPAQAPVVAINVRRPARRGPPAGPISGRLQPRRGTMRSASQFGRLPSEPELGRRSDGPGRNAGSSREARIALSIPPLTRTAAVSGRVRSGHHASGLAPTGSRSGPRGASPLRPAPRSHPDILATSGRLDNLPSSLGRRSAQPFEVVRNQAEPGLVLVVERPQEAVDHHRRHSRVNTQQPHSPRRPMVDARRVEQDHRPGRHDEARRRPSRS